MERFPSGIGQKGFLQKDVSKGFPPWLARVEVPKKGGVVHHPLVSDTRSLLSLSSKCASSGFDEVPTPSGDGNASK